MGRKNKRSIEEIGKIDGVSPPSKMAPRNRSDSKSDEIITKLDALGARLSNLEKEVGELTRALQEMESIRKNVDSMKDSIEGFQRLELESKRRSVLIRGLPFRTSEKFETRQQTKLVLADLFKRLDMTPHLVDYQRLGGLKAGEDGSKVSIRVQFVTVDQKFDLFDALKGKGRDMNDISILTDYPAFQLQEFKKLSGLAFNIRKDNPGTRTRIVPKGLGLILQKRANVQDRWTAVSLLSGSSSSSQE
jgi:hypothetical protein